MEFCFDIVFPSVNVSLYVFFVCHYLSCFFLTKTNKDKGRIHWNCSALPRVFLVINVFSCFKRIPEVLLPSSTPNLSKSLHFIQFEVPNRFPTLPHRDLCKIEPHSPDPNLPFTFEPTKHHQIQSNTSVHIPNLKSVIISVISSFHWPCFMRLTRRALSRPGRASYQVKRGLMLP